MTALDAALIGVDGSIIRFDGLGGYRLARDFGLFGVAPVELRSVDSAGLTAGSMTGRPRRQATPVVLRCIVEGATPTGLYEAVERLAAAVDPVTPGSRFGRDTRIVVGRNGQPSRALSARYSSGLGQWRILTTGQTIAEFELLFRADDPRWSELQPAGVSVVFPVTGTGSEDTAFDDPASAFDALTEPFDGFQATAEEGTSMATLTNDGDAETWPLWQITGAATTVEVSNRRTGAVWRWSGNLTAADRLVVDTNDRHPSVRVNGSNAWGGLAADANDLFALVAGANEVIVTVLDGDTNSTLECSWLPRWQTA